LIFFVILFKINEFRKYYNLDLLEMINFSFIYTPAKENSFFTDIKTFFAVNVLRYICFSIFIIPLVVSGQGISKSDRLLEKSTALFEQKDYGKAVTLAKRTIEADPGNIRAYLLLADIFHETDSLRNEIFYLREAAELTDSQPLIFYRLGEALYKNGKYTEALDAVNKFISKESDSRLQTKATILKTQCEFAADAVKKPVRFSPENLGDHINTQNDEYWPSLTVDSKMLVFTRLLPVTNHTGLKQEDFYMSESDSAGWKPAHPMTGLNSPMNEGAQFISSDGKLLFFTLCNHRNGYGSCDIWFSVLRNNQWSVPQNAGEMVNTPGWEGQPSFSAFGNFLYFSSTRQGGKGNKDIWRIHLKGWSREGIPEWSDLINLGDSINTPGDEISPFIHPNGKDLYFSSDYWPGFGGYDLFHTIEKDNNTWTKPANLGYPVNSPGNEQGLVIDRTGKTAYFSTNREQKGNMDIYRFETDEEFRPEAVTYLRGKVINSRTGMPVAARVEIKGSNKEQPLDIKTEADENGVFLITLPPDRDLSFTVNKEGYLFYSERFVFAENSSTKLPVERLIKLEPAEVQSLVNLYNIFFATNEYEILPESEPELNSLLGFLKDNPSLSVEIGGHTDNVGSVEFNRQLSEKRANSVRQYLLDKGIEPQRLTAKGYGLELPVASNDSEEVRARNRRTTIRIIN
jgi:outer membrane protein OmpA-like peptidoglycan-associated protein